MKAGATFKTLTSANLRICKSVCDMNDLIYATEVWKRVLFSTEYDYDLKTIIYALRLKYPLIRVSLCVSLHIPKDVTVSNHK